MEIVAPGQPKILVKQLRRKWIIQNEITCTGIAPTSTRSFTSSTIAISGAYFNEQNQEQKASLDEKIHNDVKEASYQIIERENTYEILHDVSLEFKDQLRDF